MSSRKTPMDQSRLDRTTVQSEQRLTDHDELIESLIDRARELNIIPTRNAVIDMLTHDEEAARTVDEHVNDRLAEEIKSRNRRTSRIIIAIFATSILIGLIVTQLSSSWIIVLLHMADTIRSNIILFGSIILWFGACLAVGWQDIAIGSQKIGERIHRFLARRAQVQEASISYTASRSLQQQFHSERSAARGILSVGAKASPVLLVLSLLIAFSGLFLYQRISNLGQRVAIFEPDSAVLISQSSEQVVAPGQHFSIQFTLENSSNRPWNSQDGYALTCLSSCFNASSVGLPETQVVAPGKQHSFQITLIASQPLGLFQTRWVLTYQDQPFGPILTVPIEVVKQTIRIGWSTAYPTWIWMSVTGFAAGQYTFSCNFSTPPTSEGFSIKLSGSPQSFDDGHTCYDSLSGDHIWVKIDGSTSNTLTVP